MRVALCIRPDWVEKPGGDVMQLRKTKEALEASFPVLVTIVGDPESADFAEADIIHVFNVQQPEIGLPFLRKAKAQGKPTVLSTIFWDLSHAHIAMVLARFGWPMAPWVKPLKGVLVGLFGLLGKPRYFSSSYRALVREMVSLADLCLPNSGEEMGMLEGYTGLKGCEFRVVVNAVDSSTFRNEGSPERAGVVLAGGFEAVKGHLSVLRALRDQPEIPVTFIGRPSNERYFAAVQGAASKRGNVTIIPENRSQPEVAELFRHTLVHVNPSLRESPGLASMEALASGCRIVISSEAFCPVNTYFGDFVGKSAFLCDPYDPASIRSAIDQAMASTTTTDLDAWREEFSWHAAAQQTFEAYEQVNR